MKTPSGRIHVGSLRGVVVHDLVYRALQDRGVKARFTYVFEDHDPMDGLPHYLDAKIWSQYLGKPLFSIPSPVSGFDSYAKHYAFEFQKVFEKIGSRPEIVWTSSLYFDGRMNKDIKISLDNVDKIKKIYQEIYHKDLSDSWYPFQAVCPNCGKESTTKVTGWDGEKVTFSCNINQVDWTLGCGYSGKISPYSGKDYYAGKLPWKVEWAVKWKVIGVTIEGAGKDHMSAGGSHDVASRICREVINYPVPFPVPYEFFLIRGKKMSSSKGLGSSAKEVSEIIPPYLLRFLMVRTQIQQTIDFDPFDMTIPDLFDEYDRCRIAYIQKSDADLARIFELSQVTDDFIPKDIFIPRFRVLAQIIQFPNVDPQEYFAKEKKSKLTTEETAILEERIKYALIWLEKYAPGEMIFSPSIDIPQDAKQLSDVQKKYLSGLIKIISSTKSPEDLQIALYEEGKKSGIKITDAFQAIYVSILGKTHGPKAAWLLYNLDHKFLEKRFQEIQSLSEKEITSKQVYSDKLSPEIFSIDSKLKEKYPSLQIGVALIKDVKIGKTDTELQKNIDEFKVSQSQLTTEKIGQYPEVISYRRLYKDMNVDWHSRRPSPEALLRRIALKKGLYNVNNCVDAYNLIVMKERISVGAFDLDKVKFPTILRFAGEGDEILLLGDKEPTKYTGHEIAYYDRDGGYNLDFNFRDAQRTAVTGSTKNLLINIDGVFDITLSQMQKTLEEVVAIILKYCGGKLEFMGVVK
ncbi:lysine--tRNA ligase [Candidatus Gottesmanbacteria bacterium]|nr:lysine--tRNA ligase [Candidatus Gottesmanbacteria bacterium]